jgi:hypothetical protein
MTVHDNIQANVLPLHTMQVQRWSKGIVLLILNFGIGCRWVVNAMLWLLYTQQRAPVPTVQDGWAPGTVWTDVVKRKSLAPTRVQTPKTIKPVASHYTDHVIWSLTQHYCNLPENQSAMKNTAITTTKKFKVSA